MSNICNLLRDMIKDEEKAPSEYEKIKVKMIGHPDKKKIISKIQSQEKEHHKKVKELAEELGCNCKNL